MKINKRFQQFEKSNCLPLALDGRRLSSVVRPVPARVPLMAIPSCSPAAAQQEAGGSDLFDFTFALFFGLFGRTRQRHTTQTTQTSRIGGGLLLSRARF
jgi:hypothetical protein